VSKLCGDGVRITRFFLYRLTNTRGLLATLGRNLKRIETSVSKVAVTVDDTNLNG